MGKSRAKAGNLWDAPGDFVTNTMAAELPDLPELR
jgi:hypothetical protein